MGIVVRQSIKSAIVGIFGAVLGAVTLLGSAGIFSKEHLGFTRMLANNSGTLAFVAILGFNYAIIIQGQKFATGHKNREGFLRYSFTLPGLFTLLLCAFLLLFKEPIIRFYCQPQDYEIVRKYFATLPTAVILNFILLWFEGYLVSINRAAMQALVRDVIYRIVYIVLVLFYALDWISFDVFIWSFALGLLIPIIISYAAVRKHKGFVFTGGTPLSKVEKKEITIFSVYQMLNAVGVMVMYSLDTILLTPFAKDGIQALAVYSIAFFVATFIRTPSRMMATAVTPTFVDLYNENDLPKLRELYWRSAVNMFAASVIVAVILIINVDNLQRFLAHIAEGYELIKPLTLILIGAALSDVICGPNTEMIGLSKYFRVNFWFTLSVIILIFILNAWLIKVIGITGAAWASAIGMATYNILKSILLWVKYKIHPFSKNTVLLLIVGAGMVTLFYFIPYFGNMYFDTIIRSVVALILLILLLYKLKTSKEITDFINNIISNKRLY